MPIISTYGPNTAYESKRYDSIQLLLDQLQDNTANLIYANHVRDAVYTLWERVSEVEIIAASAASTSMFFQNDEPTLEKIGGIPAGSSFPTPQTFQDMFDLLLYPYIAPVASIFIDGGVTRREYGASPAVTLNWTATKKSKPITSIVVNGTNISVVNGTTQTGTRPVLGSYITSPPASTINTFSINVGDGDNTTTSSTTLQWMNKIYWGTIDLTSIGNPNLTLNPGSASIINITRATILALDGAGVGLGSDLATSKNKTYNQIDGNGKYLIFAWPSSVVGATAPSFTVGGFNVNLFKNVKTAWSFMNNTNNFTTNYEVWVSNTAYNSPANIVIS